jgi:hypothetical protein
MDNIKEVVGVFCAFFVRHFISNGWLQNCNSTRTQLLAQSPKRNYLPYMAPDGESFLERNSSLLRKNIP